MRLHQVVSLQSLIHSAFVCVDVIELGEDLDHPCYFLRLHPLDDKEVEDITICISECRAIAAKLVSEH